MSHHPLDPIKGKFAQRGFGDYTLCDRCNSSTGDWYVKEYAKWAKQAAMLLALSDGDPRGVYIYHGFPLRFFKQVITMFASVNTELTRVHPDICHYILSRTSREYNTDIRLYVFYNPITRILKKRHDGNKNHG